MVAEADVDDIASFLMPVDKNQQRIEVARVGPERDESPASRVVPVCERGA